MSQRADTLSKEDTDVANKNMKDDHLSLVS